MNGNFIKIITVVFLLAVIILSSILIIFKHINNFKKNEQFYLYEKISEEIKYYDSNIISAMNKLNNIVTYRYRITTERIDVSKDQNSESEATSSEKTDNLNSTENEDSVLISESNQVESLDNDEKQNWLDICYIYDNLYLTWPTFSLDLYKANISDEIIENLGYGLDGIAQSIKAKDKNSCLNNLYNCYLLFPKIIELISNDSFYLNTYNSKVAFLNSYILVNQGKWENVLSSIESTIYYINCNISISKEKDVYNYKKIYIMLEDIKNCVELNDTDIFFMKYKNIIQQMILL